MEKLRKILNMVDDYGRFPKGCAPIDVYTLRECEDKVRRGKNYYTISKAVADVCDKCGLAVVVDGIGWKIMGVR